MARKPIDITGNKYNKLTAIKYVNNEKWLFKCDCGRKVIKYSADVKRSKTKACCRKCFTGNPSKHPLYQTWDGIKKRCYNKNATGYKNYGGRGIKMSDRWLNFWDFVEDIGKKPFVNDTIERINNNGDYSKANCKWSSKKEQANNKRNNIYIYYNNKKYTFYNLCKKLNLTVSTTYWRYKKSNLSGQEYFEKYIF